MIHNPLAPTRARFRRLPPIAAPRTFPAHVERSLQSLSPQERRVFDATMTGDNAVAVGKSLGISPKTVKNHTSMILLKFHVASRIELLALFVAPPPTMTRAR